jgi:hypothetical protein
VVFLSRKVVTREYSLDRPLGNTNLKVKMYIVRAAYCQIESQKYMKLNNGPNSENIVSELSVLVGRALIADVEDFTHKISI